MCAKDKTVNSGEKMWNEIFEYYEYYQKLLLL